MENKKNKENKENKVHLTDVNQMYAGLFSAGASCHCGDPLKLNKLRIGPNRKRHEVFSFESFEAKKQFVLLFNGFITCNNTTKFLNYCNDVGVLFKPQDIISQAPHEDWIYGFMLDRIRVSKTLETGRLHVYIYYSDKNMLDWFKKQFGGAVIQRNTGYLWETSHKAVIINAISFLMKKRNTDCSALQCDMEENKNKKQKVKGE